ncbi:MAG: TnsD family Tn7-like transposition protein [Pyrinomonadaceae bacterium]
MIGFFTDVYPDELLYSACARYAKRAKYPHKQSILIELFGRRGLSAIVDFPTRLDYFVSILPRENYYSSESLINKNTLLPFYEPFLPLERAKLVRQEMKGDSKDNVIRTRLATNVKQVKMPEFLRFCPICIEEDRREFGSAYWHRIHQLPGILVCSLHHCFLENSPIKWERSIGNYFRAAEEIVSSIKPKYVKKEQADYLVLIKLAEDAKWLFSQNNFCLGANIIRERYFNLLLKQEYAYYNGRIRNNKLFRAFQNYFSPSLLETLGCSIESTHRSWIFRLIEKSKTDILHHPIRHLLMMTFLGLTAKEFFTSFVEFKPFLDGPYPCLSRAADHYGELRIQNCEVFDNLTKGKRRGKPIAVFTCDCGFIYQRIGPDKSENDRMRYDSIREYGIVWEKKLEEMWNDLSLSRAEIARRLKISDLSITTIARRLNLPMNAIGARVSNNKFHCKPPRRTLSESREICRKNLKKVVKENPTANRDKLIKLVAFEYQWLMRNDTEWMKNHLPDVLNVPRKKETLDWKKIDAELSPKVEEACKKIYLTIPLKRVCITEIIREVGFKKWIEKRHLKLPKTKKVIDENLESLEDYMIRKLKQAESLYIKERKIPDRDKLMRRAVIINTTTNNSTRVQTEILISLIRIRKAVE